MTTEEHMQNVYNWSVMASAKVPVVKRKRFLSRQIHKLKKMLKLRSNAVAHKDLSTEEMQNAHNERISDENGANEELRRQYEKLDWFDGCDSDSDYGSENWDNWDACYLCAGRATTHRPESDRSPSPNYSSICYVFMPGQTEPVPVKLRTTRIPGGVMWISYRPDLDIHSINCCSYTSSQCAQAQQPPLVI